MEFTTDLEPDIVGCDRYEQFVKLVSIYWQIEIFTVYFDVFFFNQPEDKREELEKQAMAYQVDQTTDVNVGERSTNPTN